MFYTVWRFVTLALLRPMYKWFLRKLTGKCELQRIMDRTESGAGRTLKIETSLKHSKYAALKQILRSDNVDVQASVAEIHKVKDISQEVHPLFGPALSSCISQICGYRQLLAQVETERKVSYNTDDKEHEVMLLELWNKLCPDIRLESRISKQWGDIGFQGEDPMTDFRGMGILGLKNLLFLVTKHSEVSQQLLLHSRHPKYGYSFAIVGINITGMTYKLLKKGDLKTHCYNATSEAPTMENFHHIYCCFFYDFDKFWRDEEPQDIMQFNVVRKKYENKMVKFLRGDKKASLDELFPVAAR